ncbi:MAG: inositol monophosphatase family protein [Pseudomonadota bacterium]
MGRSALINVMVDAAMKAGRSLRRDFNEVEKLQVSVKGPADFVSAADKRAESIIHRELDKARPGYGFLMEESGTIEGTDKAHRWIVDPLDGTTNFLHGNPIFCTSIGLEREGTLVAGVIYNPIMDEIFTAERGSGAFMNNTRIRVSGRTRLEESVISMSMPHAGRPELAATRFREFAALIPLIAGLRSTGSSAMDLAWVGAGRHDAYWQENLKAWDIAAGVLIAREAGAIVTDLFGEGDMLNNGTIMAANATLHDNLLPKIQAARAKV